MRKKTLFIAGLALTCILALSGCGNKPDKVVSKFCDGMKKLDYAKMNECLYDSSDYMTDPFEGDDEELEVFTSFVKEQAPNIKYEITGSEVNGDDATVNVKFTYTDASPVITSAMGEYFSQALGLAFSGASEEQMGNLLLTIFQDKLKTTTLSTTESTVDIPCKKKDGDWKVAELSDDIANVLTCNILKAFEKVGDSFGGSDEGSSGASNQNGIAVVNSTGNGGEEEEELVYTDVPAGQEVQLATLKLTVLNCEEAHELKNSYSTDTAEDGTKYVVFTIKAENITKNPIDCSISDVPIMDSQGRYFSMDTDATFDMDDYILYKELNPNMPQTGTVVYKVPDDSTGYGMMIEHADTGETYKFLAN